MEIVNYRLTTTQPDGSEHVDVFGSADSAYELAATLRPWPTKVEEQRMTVDIGSVVTVRSSGNSREITGTVDSIDARPVLMFHIRTGNPRESWFAPRQVVTVHDPAEVREHEWLPPVEGIRTCRRLGCYAQWMPGKSERLGCKGTSSE